MNWDQIKSDWNQVSNRIKVTWGKLSDDALTKIAGNREQMAVLLAERYGYERVQADNKVDDFARRLSTR